MAIFSVRVAASSDDAEEEDSGGNMSTTSSDLELVTDPSLAGKSQVGCRFLSVTIDNAETINSATVTFTVDEATTSGTPSVRIACEDVDDATTFTTTVGDISNRTRTTADVVWNLPTFDAVDEEYTSEDFASSVQEVVNRAGWANGNDLNVFFDYESGTESDPRTAESFDGESASAPIIEIDFGATAATGPDSLLMLMGVG